MRPVIRLLGPSVDEAVRFAAETFGKRAVIVWGIPPEVHVKCDHGRVVEAFLRKFGEGVVSIVDGSLQETVTGLLLAEASTLATAESCTGGNIGHLLTNVPGVSACYLGGVIAYDNRIKEQVLGVAAETLTRFGAVSEKTVQEMALGVRKVMGADWGLAVSGYAGPHPHESEHPVGTVWLAVSGPKGKMSEEVHLRGTREEIKGLAALHALNLLRRSMLGDKGE